MSHGFHQQYSNCPINSSSSFSEPQLNYQVFLSFRGKDTRYTFTDHLYQALVGKGINTFRDEDELETGRGISRELLNAIETSRMAVIILSRNYASSTWCLEELAKILECMQKRGMRVLPVFYHVDPSDVRHQRGTFADAFDKQEEHIKENIEMVQRWRAALREVAGLAGHHLKDGRYESKFIKEIVDKISHELNYTTLSVSYKKYGLVGIDSRVQDIMDLYIDVASDDVRFIGIYGMSGIGKTTLAEVVFERIRSQFEASSFLKDVKRSDLNDSQDQLLRDLKLKSKIPRWDVLNATNSTRLRLHDKRVIIVLDDADEEKLKKLGGSYDWIGPGSRIIITTEDKDLLWKICGNKNVYKAKKLIQSEALQLFSREAFDKPPCEKDLLDICNHFVSYVDGHPLALKILGSSMRDKPIDLWKAQLKRLRESVELHKDERIQTALRISYNGLRTPKKRLFLEIACFLNGKDKDRIANIVEGSGCFPENDIKALIDKSFITILEGKLWMHNLLQQMGWEIFNQEEKHSRSWRCDPLLHEDALRVLKSSKGTDSAEGILLKSPPYKEVRLNISDAFSKMKELRLLKICDVHLPQGHSIQRNELRMIEWHDCRFKSIPRSFQPDKLVELIMPCSHIKELPEGFSNLGRLKFMDLSDSQNLIKTPNFIGLPNLEKVIFQGCTRLHEVHPSIGVLKRLTLLNLKDCKYLNSLPPEIKLESLEIFNLSGCSRLNKFPEVGRSMTSLSELYLDGTAIEELPLSIEHLTGLTLLNLQHCKNFSSFPGVIIESLKTLILSGCKVQPHESWNSMGLSPILSLCTYCFFIAQHPEPEPNFLLLKSSSGLGSLVSLDLSFCNLEDGALPDDLSCLSSLQYLNLSKNHFTCLPDSVSQLSKLKFLYLDNCSRLKSLANIPLGTPFVMARECTSLENSNQGIACTSGETSFTFIDCLSLVDDEECEVSEVSLLDIHFQPLRQRYMEDQIHQMEGLHSFVPQTEIPQWFSYQNRSGTLVPFRLPDQIDGNDSSWRGIVLFLAFKVNNVSPGQIQYIFGGSYVIRINSHLSSVQASKDGRIFPHILPR